MQGSAHLAATRELIVDIERVIVFPLIALLSAVALMVFIWGVFQYILNADDATARAKGRRHMISGIIGLTIMIGAYTILQIAAFTVGCDISSGTCGEVNTNWTPPGNP